MLANTDLMLESGNFELEINRLVATGDLDAVFLHCSGNPHKPRFTWSRRRRDNHHHHHHYTHADFSFAQFIYTLAGEKKASLTMSLSFQKSHNVQGLLFSISSSRQNMPACQSAGSERNLNWPQLACGVWNRLGESVP